jgi:hypothetical protein
MNSTGYFAKNFAYAPFVLWSIRTLIRDKVNQMEKERVSEETLSWPAVPLLTEPFPTEPEPTGPLQNSPYHYKIRITHCK